MARPMAWQMVSQSHTSSCPIRSRLFRGSGTTCHRKRPPRQYQTTRSEATGFHAATHLTQAKARLITWHNVTSAGDGTWCAASFLISNIPDSYRQAQCQDSACCFTCCLTQDEYRHRIGREREHLQSKDSRRHHGEQEASPPTHVGLSALPIAKLSARAALNHTHARVRGGWGEKGVWCGSGTPWRPSCRQNAW